MARKVILFWIKYFEHPRDNILNVLFRTKVWQNNFFDESKIGNRWWSGKPDWERRSPKRRIITDSSQGESNAFLRYPSVSEYCQYSFESVYWVRFGVFWFLNCVTFLLLENWIRFWVAEKFWTISQDSLYLRILKFTEYFLINYIHCFQSVIRFYFGTVSQMF